MGIVSTIPEKCRRCYTCVRECPAKAIKVENGQAMVIEDRCIVCGNCVKVCAQQAKLIEDSTAEVSRMLSESQRTFACLAPSFPAAFPDVTPGKVVAGVRQLGFDEVWEVAFGAELISREYVELFKVSQRTGACVITSPCPAIVAYIEKYMPSLRGTLAPIVSPMVAIGRAIQERHGEDVRVVFIGPCIAKKNEISDPSINGAVDSVLTFRELVRMLEAAGIELGVLGDSGFDGPRCYMARSFAISGGLLKTAGLSTDILENDIVITEGKDRVIEALQEVAEGKSQARLLDVLFCEGCINGPKMPNDLSVFARKEILADYVNDQSRYISQKEFAETLDEFKGIDLTREFSRPDLQLRQPTEDEIQGALEAMRKLSPEDQLNCGACGYRTCRDKAIAVCQDLAEPEMCLPYIVEELETALGEIRKSHEELESTQQRLLQSERLASMGQLSAGVAHEINNPLGTILLYSHMMLRQLRDDDERKTDLEMVVDEATRCRNIVRGLLDFARQSRVSKEPSDLAELIHEVVTIVSVKAESNGIQLAEQVSDGLPTVMLDGDQIKQMLVNIVENGIDACASGGAVKIAAKLLPDTDRIQITIEDRGCGVAEENLSKLFTPFFTTKEMGKGTGLGLAIAYGVIKMHSGDITVDSEVGKGTTFTISVPVGSQEDIEKETIGG